MGYIKVTALKIHFNTPIQYSYTLNDDKQSTKMTISNPEVNIDIIINDSWTIPFKVDNFTATI
jgi:hypothetical protein